MLVSYLLLPDAFGPGSVNTKADRQAAEIVFSDILDSGIVVDYTGCPTLKQIEKDVEQLRPQLKQRLLILIEEIKKQKKVLFATPADRQPWTLKLLVAALKPEVAVVPRSGTTIDHVPEAVSVEDYLDSAARRRVRDFRVPRVPAAHLEASRLDALLGSFLKYSRSVTIIDKMMGRSAKDGVLKPRFTKGVDFVVDCWSRNTVYKQDRLEVVIVTTAGDCGASGYVDPVLAGQAIRDALAHVAATVKVVLKQDESPGVFHARYVKARGRCCKLDPGIDALAGRGAKCLCLQIDPPCEAANAIARDILKLPELAHNSQ